MFLAKISINRPIMVTMGILVLMIFGFLAYTTLNLNRTPEVDIPFVTVQTIYPGAGPKEIETQISKKIEDAVATVSEIKRIESYSLDGVSIVLIEFNLTKDVDVASQEVKDKIDVIINDLPEDADDPITEKFDIGAEPILDLVLSGKDQTPQELFDIADRQLKDMLSQIKGVANVELVGGQEREIQVQFDSKTVYENMISMPQLMQILAAHNMNLPGGYFNINDLEYTVRVTGEYEDLKDIRELEVPTAFGNKKMKQIADVVDGGKKIRERAVYFNNKSKLQDNNVVRLSIIKSTDGNEVDVADEVKARLPEISNSLPEGCTLEIINDKSTFTRSTVDDTISNIILGVIFTSIVLLFFLHDLRSTFIIALSMPTSVIITFLLMQMAGFTQNMMSLMGISVSIGVLVANSVVVLENIFRHKQMGGDKKQSAYKGTTEVTVAVIASTLTNIVVFVPLGNIDSIAGQFLKELAFTAAFATLVSLIISFTLTPMLASLLLPEKQKTGAISRFIESILDGMANLYSNSLKFVMKNKVFSSILVVASFALFFFATNFYGSRLAGEFMPTMDDGKIKIEVELPQGYNLDETADVMSAIESRLGKYDDISHTITNLGKKGQMDIGTNLAVMEVYFNSANERYTGILDYTSYLTQDLADIPNADIKISVMESMGGGGAPIEFFIMGQNLDTLESLKSDFYAKSKEIPGLINYDFSSRPGKPEITVAPKRGKVTQAGLSEQEIAVTVRSAIEGMEATQYKENGEEYDVMVTLDRASVDTPEEIKNIPIVSQRGVVYRLAQVADVDFTSGVSKVIHRDKYTAIKFTGYNAPGTATGTLLDDLQKVIDEMPLPEGYQYKWAGTTEMQKEMAADLGFAGLLAIILTYMLLAAILESFWQPVLILLTLPLAFIGVFILMYYTDTNIGLTAMMGMIMLIGIVVNNAILILDYVNQLVREEGFSAKEALIKAAPVKLKPILMSTIAIILGMLPMAMGIGDAGKEMRIPLGIVSIGGLVASTVLTLYVVPAFMYVTSRTKKA